ncbi:hypothetical protein [Halalkalicoccus tibetensis]|uniref:Uncharacterized protein n=1 Tax=Halalkalicoccus tibetensis TaxID=175632 RepID=A0ABD5UYD4_9EURY
MSTASDGDGGFLTFYRQYAHTGIHTVTATALTAFGLLTFVHRGFVALAIAVYVLPPIYLYLTRNGEAPEPIDGDGASGADDRERPTTGDTPAATGAGNGDGAAAASDAGEDRPDRIDEPTPDTGLDPESSDRESTDPEGPAREEVAEPEPGEDREDAGDAPEATTTTGSATTGGETGSPDDEHEAESEIPSESTNENAVEDPDSGPEPAEDPRTGERAEPATSDVAGPEARRSPKPDASEDGAVADEGAVADDEGEEDGGGSAEWVEADSPTEETLLDAVSAGEGAYAAGKNGALLARSEDGDWELALESGPAAESTTLRGVDATDDGDAIWVAGDGGVLGRYDPATARHTDHSAPDGITDNWSGLAVAGAAGEERVALVNGSGQVLFGGYDGSEVEWDEPVKPGSGSSMSAIAFVDESTGYCCDTNAGVYRVEGSEFERIGIEDASGFDALAATGDTVAVASGDGTLQRFDGSVWTPVRVAEGSLSGLAADGEEWLAVGAGGTIHENREGGWETVDSPTKADLHGVAVGKTPVVVGADGTVVERV